MKRTILLLATLLLACGAINAQNLVFHDVRDLVEDSNAPKFAIFTEEYYNSLEWFDLSQRINNYSYAKAAEEMSREIVQAKKDIAEAKARGENVEFMEEILRTREEAVAAYKAVGGGLSGQGLMKEVLSHAIGGRLFYGADLAFPDYAKVQGKPYKEDPDDFNVWGVMDSKGKIIIPFRYQDIFTNYNRETGDRLPLIFGIHEIDRWKDKWEVDVYKLDGSLATKQKYAGVYVFEDHVVGVHFLDGGWGLMDKDCRILTAKKYKKLDWNTNNLTDASQGNFIYGERDGVNYILSPKDGSEIGTFKFDPGVSHEVSYYPGKDPRKK